MYCVDDIFTDALPPPMICKKIFPTKSQTKSKTKSKRIMIKSDVQSGQIRSFNDPCDGRANSHLRRCPSRIPQVLTWKMAGKNIFFS